MLSATPEYLLAHFFPLAIATSEYIIQNIHWASGHKRGCTRRRNDTKQALGTSPSSLWGSVLWKVEADVACSKADPSWHVSKEASNSTSAQPSRSPSTRSALLRGCAIVERRQHGVGADVRSWGGDKENTSIQIEHDDRRTTNDTHVLGGADSFVIFRACISPLPPLMPSAVHAFLKTYLRGIIFALYRFVLFRAADLRPVPRRGSGPDIYSVLRSNLQVFKSPTVQYARGDMHNICLP